MSKDGNENCHENIPILNLLFLASLSLEKLAAARLTAACTHYGLHVSVLRVFWREDLCEGEGHCGFEDILFGAGMHKH